MTAKSFSVRIYLQDGHASGVKIVSKSKWAGRGLVIPCAVWDREKERDELRASGVFVLQGEDAAGRPTLSVGAAASIGSQLAGPVEGRASWSTAIIFTCKEDSLDADQAEYLAARLLRLAEDAGRTTLCHPSPPRPPELSAAQAAGAETFLDHMLSLLPLLGVTAFEA